MTTTKRQSKTQWNLPKQIKAVQGLFTLAELAAIAGCSVITLYREIKQGRLKAVRSNGQGRALLVPRTNAADYLADRQKNRR